MTYHKESAVEHGLNFSVNKTCRRTASIRQDSEDTLINKMNHPNGKKINLVTVKKKKEKKLNVILT